MTTSIARYVGTDVKRHAEAVLKHLMLGTEVAGLRFGLPQLLFSTEANKPRGVPYINLGSRWEIYGSRPIDFPLEEADLEEISSGEELQLLIGLRHKTVVGIEVLEPAPHLVLTFNDNTVFYLNGHNTHYEAWDAGLSYSDFQTWLVVAGLEDVMTIFAPDEFWESAV